jgi:LytR cell envelope-related transcriptional attenuator
VSLMRPPGRSDVPRFRPVDRRKRIKAVTVVGVSVVAIGCGAWAFGINSKSKGSLGCTLETYVPPPVQHTKVNVYNGTLKAGFAEQVADELRQRGFTIGQIANDPLRRKIRGTGEIRYGDDGKAQLDALRPWQGGMNPVFDRRNGADVDFVIGAKFETLYDAPKPPPGVEMACIPNAPTTTNG